MTLVRQDLSVDVPPCDSPSATGMPFSSDVTKTLPFCLLPHPSQPEG